MAKKLQHLESRRHIIAGFKKFLQRVRVEPKKNPSDELLCNYPLSAPKSFMWRIKKGNLHDPLLLQILPQAEEARTVKGFSTDPLSECKHSPVKGLIHKYYGRVLLLLTANCPINCRFCFRRFSREEITDWNKVFSYIKSDPTISEVIFSGGDPLILCKEELVKIIKKIATISHVKQIRIHTRIPIVKPELITKSLIRSLVKTRIKIIFVVHCNHPQEINSQVETAIKIIRSSMITVLNQSVLLRGINDRAETLIELSEKLFKIGILPYYLHMLDKVQGAAHFYVPPKKAKLIYREMQKKLPGYLVPKLVLSVPGVNSYKEFTY